MTCGLVEQLQPGFPMRFWEVHGPNEIEGGHEFMGAAIARCGHEEIEHSTDMSQSYNNLPPITGCFLCVQEYQDEAYHAYVG